jgi:hypothetical protein
MPIFLLLLFYYCLVACNASKPVIVVWVCYTHIIKQVTSIAGIASKSSHEVDMVDFETLSILCISSSMSQVMPTFTLTLLPS